MIVTITTAAVTTRIKKGFARLDGAVRDLNFIRMNRATKEHIKILLINCYRSLFNLLVSHLTKETILRPIVDQNNVIALHYWPRWCQIIAQPDFTRYVRQDTNCIYFEAGKKLKFVFRFIWFFLLFRLLGIFWYFVRIHCVIPST